MLATYVRSMVDVTVSGGQIVVTLSGADVVWALKRRLVVSVRSVRAVTVTDDVRPWLGVRGNQLGLRLPGTAIPWRLVAGSYWRPGTWTFCCLHRGQRALVIDLDSTGVRYDRFVLGVRGAERIRDAIDDAIRQSE